MTPSETNLLGIAVLSLMGLALAVWIVHAIRRMPFTVFQTVFFGLNYVLARVLWRAKVEGTFSLPPNQGAVIICNHRGSLDPSFLYLATQRLIHWLVAREYVNHPIFGQFLRRVGTIPVGRTGIDTAATKMAIRYTQEGGLVGMFPEGRINHGDQVLLPGRPGAALIALKARVPVIPCYLFGSPYQDDSPISPFYTPTKARLVIGQPIDLSPYFGREDDREVLQELTKRFLKEMAALAGQPDFEPQVAGRFYRGDLVENGA